MRILGQTTHHDASVCLLEDGNVIRFYKEERLNVVKKGSGVTEPQRKEVTWHE